MEDIYFVEVKGNEVKPYINLNPEKIVSKKVDTIEIKDIFLESSSNASFELDGMGEVRLIKQELKDLPYDLSVLKHILLGDIDEEIDIEEDIDEDDLFM